MKKILILALLTMAGVAVASDSKADEPPIRTSAGRAARNSTHDCITRKTASRKFIDFIVPEDGKFRKVDNGVAVIRALATNFKNHKGQVSRLCEESKDLIWVVGFGDATETYEKLGKGLKEIRHVHIMGNMLNKIQSEFFRNCPNLVSVSLPDGISTINAGFLRDCPALLEVRLPGGIGTIHVNFLENSPLAKVILTAPDSVTQETLSRFGIEPSFENAAVAAAAPASMPTAASAPVLEPAPNNEDLFATKPDTHQMMNSILEQCRSHK